MRDRLNSAGARLTRGEGDERVKVEDGLPKKARYMGRVEEKNETNSGEGQRVTSGQS